MAEGNKCAHKFCSCPVPENETYRSDGCEEAAAKDIIEITFDCGHTSCT